MAKYVVVGRTPPRVNQEQIVVMRDPMRLRVVAAKVGPVVKGPFAWFVEMQPIPAGGDVGCASLRIVR